MIGRLYAILGTVFVITLIWAVGWAGGIALGSLISTALSAMHVAVSPDLTGYVGALGALVGAFVGVRATR